MACRLTRFAGPIWTSANGHGRRLVSSPLQHAREVRNSRANLLAPAVLRWELGNVLRLEGVAQGLLTPDEVVQALRDLPLLGVQVREDDEASTQAAARLSSSRSVSFFDAAFVVVALRTGLPLLTADARLARGVAGLVSTELLRGAVPGPAAS